MRGQANAHDATAGSEHLADRVLGGAEGEVAQEQGVALGAGLVTERTGASLSPVLTTGVLVGGTASGVIKVDRTAVNLAALLSLVGLGRVDVVGEFNVTESGQS